MGNLVCTDCGARMVEDAGRCELCGSLRSDTVAVPQSGNSGATGASEEAKMSSLGVRVAMLVGIPVLIVIALFMITEMSRQRIQPEAAPVAAMPAEMRSAAVINEFESIPVASQYALVVDSLQALVHSGDETIALEAQRELVRFMAEIGRIDRAAIEQQRLARRTGSTADWRHAGTLLYAWMEAVYNERKTDVALLAIEAFGKVLEQNPDDVDIRADLGWAYQYDPQNPMEAIRQTNLALEQDPDHLAANYNRAVFLLRINRINEALEQFGRVVVLAEDGSVYERQAEAWIRTIRENAEAS